ncbi:unnamed protein product [Mytilus edulis]|uniref:C-type lectin domain-containing protein n=1 Tax=Mytilus edulis TaxID=6550 RepID=A0A8S3QDA7_MYTED|nr:unnamed protein product [Mytilus edulis]
MNTEILQQKNYLRLLQPLLSRGQEVLDTMPVRIIPDLPLICILIYCIGTEYYGNACSRAGSYLAVVDNRYEDMWIQSNLIDGAWIDATDHWHEGRWISSYYGKNLPYTRWRGGEPNNSGGNEDCAYMRADGWNDCPCNEHAIPQYVCEKIL